jgi:uncharacterized protein YxeA
MKKTVSAVLITLLLNFAFGINIFAQTNLAKGNQFIIQHETPQNIAQRNQESKDTSKSAVKAEFYKKLSQDNAGSDFVDGEKNTLTGYERQKAEGKKFSNTTKVLIGVGIAAAVIGVVIFAASRDKIKTF